MVPIEIFDAYVHALVKGERKRCELIMDQLLEEGIGVEGLYLNLFQPSLYLVGEKWEQNQISVATEHLASAITEYLMIRTQPFIFNNHRVHKKAIISCTPNEHHQIGAKIVADFFEMEGWDTLFLGANTPKASLYSLIEEESPDVVGLSMSIYYNLPELEAVLDGLEQKKPELSVIVGGQAFRWGGEKELYKWAQVSFLRDVKSLRNYIRIQNEISM